MSVRLSAVTFTIAAIIVITPTFVVSPQLAYSQQTSSTNLNFRTWEDHRNLYTVAIPTNWLGPAWWDAGHTILYHQSPDKSQTVGFIFYNPGDLTLEQFVGNQLKSISSSRGEPLRYYQVLWHGKYPAIGLEFPNYVTAFIQANGRIYNIAAQGAVLNNQAIVPVILEIINSFTIYTPEMWAADLEGKRQLQATQRQLQDLQNQILNEGTTNVYNSLSCLSGTLSEDTYGDPVCVR